MYCQHALLSSMVVNCSVFIRYGVGKWRMIQCEFPFERSNVDLKDKWRTMLNQAKRKAGKQGTGNVNMIYALALVEAEHDGAGEIMDQPQAKKTKVKSIRRSLDFGLQR